MLNSTTSRPYTPADFATCLRLFDANAPAFFAPAERADFAAFLAQNPPYYRLCLRGDEVAGSFGLSREGKKRGRLRWIMTDDVARGIGLGDYMMSEVIEQASKSGVVCIDIAASQKSAPFFAKYGALERERHPNGWGTGLDRVDMELDLNTTTKASADSA